MVEIAIATKGEWELSFSLNINEKILACRQESVNFNSHLNGQQGNDLLVEDNGDSCR